MDVLSKGRLMLGVGRGWQVPEFETFQGDQTKSRAMFLESVEIIRRAGTEDSFSFDGEFSRRGVLAVQGRFDLPEAGPEAAPADLLDGGNARVI